MFSGVATAISPPGRLGSSIPLSNNLINCHALMERDIYIRMIRLQVVQMLTGVSVFDEVSITDNASTIRLAVTAKENYVTES
jgi:hypothetical protein